MFDHFSEELNLSHHKHLLSIVATVFLFAAIPVTAYLAFAARDYSVPAASNTYVYWVHVKGAFDNSCCGINNPTSPTTLTSATFTLRKNPDPRGYEGVVCSPDCSSKGRVVWKGLVQFTPNVPGGKLVLTPQGPRDIAPPNVVLTSPSAGAELKGTVLLAAGAADNVGVRQVDFVLDNGTVVGRDTSAPYEILWVTTQAQNGSHSLFARAYDTSGNSAATVPIKVTINNPTYVYWVHVSGAFESGCCGTSNPTTPTSQTLQTFTLQTTPNPSGYTGVVCSPDCNSKVVWTGVVYFYPNTPGGKLILTPTGQKDLYPPTAPKNLTATQSSPHNREVMLRWEAATDDIKVVGYNVFRNGVLIAQVQTPYYFDRLYVDGNYIYEVSAYDASGKTSAKSNPAAIYAVLVPPL